MKKWMWGKKMKDGSVLFTCREAFQRSVARLDSSSKLFHLRPSEGKGTVKALTSGSTPGITSVACLPLTPLVQCAAAGSDVGAANLCFPVRQLKCSSCLWPLLYNFWSHILFVVPQFLSMFRNTYYWVWLGLLVWVSPTSNFFQSSSCMPHNSPSVLLYSTCNFLILLLPSSKGLY